MTTIKPAWDTIRWPAISGDSKYRKALLWVCLGCGLVPICPVATLRTAKAQAICGSPVTVQILNGAAAITLANANVTIRKVCCS